MRQIVRLSAQSGDPDVKKKMHNHKRQQIQTPKHISMPALAYWSKQSATANEYDYNCKQYVRDTFFAENRN